MRTRVQKSGNGLALRSPKPFVTKMGLEKDGEVELTAPVPCYTLEELLADVRPSNLHGETDWGPPVGKELW